MGAFTSSAQIIDIDQHHEKKTKSLFSNKPQIPLIRQVAHFTPSSFPLIPEVSKDSVAMCRKSWEELLNKSYRNAYGIEVAAITVFYNEFYRRLYMFDSNGAFDSILTKYSSKGGGNIAAKGAIIIRIMKYALTVQNNNECKENLLKLGRGHFRMQIRPWQYAIFVEMLINTIASQLGVLASPDIMSSWVHLFAFMLKYMLPSAIEGLTSATETNVAMHNPGTQEEQDQRQQQGGGGGRSVHADDPSEQVVCVSDRDSHSMIKSTLRTSEKS
jgi:hemoglobin-like flavoprotein